VRRWIDHLGDITTPLCGIAPDDRYVKGGIIFGTQFSFVLSVKASKKWLLLLLSRLQLLSMCRPGVSKIIGNDYTIVIVSPEVSQQSLF
jgi:hypothetical protein